MVAAQNNMTPSFANSKTVSPLGDFKNIPPIILQTQNGKQYKFGIDALYDSGAGGGESCSAGTPHARDASVTLKRGEEVSFTYGHPFGTTDYVKASLVSGKITIQKGANGFVRISGQENSFLQDSNPEGSSQAQIPTDLKRGSYKLVVLVTYNEELRGYYITNARVS
jgi:hypothetical protein